MKVLKDNDNSKAPVRTRQSMRLACLFTVRSKKGFRSIVKAPVRTRQSVRLACLFTFRSKKGFGSIVIERLLGTVKLLVSVVALDQLTHFHSARRSVRFPLWKFLLMAYGCTIFSDAQSFPV